MSSINYYCYSWATSDSGGGIFDANLVKALRLHNTVREFATRTFRKWTLPVWKKRTEPDRSLPLSEAVNIVSHEGLHGLLDTIQVDCYIVHNYFAEFDFPKLRIINPLYRLGSEKIYFRIFSESRRIVFLSAREKRLAAAKFPQFARNRYWISYPGQVPLSCVVRKMYPETGSRTPNGRGQIESELSASEGRPAQVEID